MNNMIKCLPKEVQGKLRSGVAIPSLQQCVEELILNSIDAGATCVGVRMDMEAFKLQVVDNGAGINAEGMECVGNRYHTSKCSSVKDLDNLSFYGFRGEAVASMVALATLVEISSRTRSSVKTLCKIFKDGKGLSVFEAETARPSAGTTVIVCNFFHNMPVRRKRLDAVLEGERIRHRVEAMSLVHPSVSFTLKNDCTGAMMVQLPKARNTYHRFVQIHGLGRAQKLGEISYSRAQFEVIGHIGREGHYNNSLQFLYVNDRLLLKTRIHKLLNFLLRRLSSSSQKNESPDAGQAATRSPKQKRSQELHGVYIINIKCSYSEYDICLEPAKTLIEFKDWDGILLCVEETVKAFLSRENLVTVLSQDDSDYESPKLFGTDSTDQEGNKNDKATISAATVDCSIGMTLASESVHRKREDHSVRLEAAQRECEEDDEEQLGQKEITADELEHIQREESRDEPQIDLASSDNNVAVEEEPTFSEAQEGTQILCMSSPVRQLEGEVEELSKGRESKLNHTALTNNLNSLKNVTQEILPDSDSNKQMTLECQSTGGHEQILISNRKISLSNPYTHESLQTQDVSQVNRQDLAVKCEERFFASKRKISLEADHDTSESQKVFKEFAPVVPSKIPKIISGEKMSLCKESGSLDKFRRIYGKCDEMKLTGLQNNARLPPQTDVLLNTRNLLVSKKDRQQQREEAQSSFRSPPTLSAFTRLKQVSAQIGGKQSLAAKLRHLNQQHGTEDVKTLPHLPRSTSQDNSCLGSNDCIQDNNNNNNNACDTALNAEPILPCTTNPQQAETEEATTSGDWLHHYDTSVGKTVYVNRVTGLSKYDDPPAEETQVRCTSDVTNMAVSVISEIGE